MEVLKVGETVGEMGTTVATDYSLFEARISASLRIAMLGSKRLRNVSKSE